MLLTIATNPLTIIISFSFPQPRGPSIFPSPNNPVRPSKTGWPYDWPDWVTSTDPSYLPTSSNLIRTILRAWAHGHTVKFVPRRFLFVCFIFTIAFRLISLNLQDKGVRKIACLMLSTIKIIFNRAIVSVDVLISIHSFAKFASSKFMTRWQLGCIEFHHI